MHNPLTTNVSLMKKPVNWFPMHCLEEQYVKSGVLDVVLVSSLLTFDKFHLLFWCFKASCVST